MRSPERERHSRGRHGVYGRDSGFADFTACNCMCSFVSFGALRLGRPAMLVASGYPAGTQKPLKSFYESIIFKTWHDFRGLHRRKTALIGIQPVLRHCDSTAGDSARFTRAPFSPDDRHVAVRRRRSPCVTVSTDTPSSMPSLPAPAPRNRFSRPSQEQVDVISPPVAAANADPACQDGGGGDRHGVMEDKVLKTTLPRIHLQQAASDLSTAACSPKTLSWHDHHRRAGGD